ncbi:MAG: chromate resistance protein ChrB domain-containing protein [Candidatus Binatia bacterium]
MPSGSDERWLLLIHQIPPKPNYLRVKIGRRLQRLGAVAIKNSVYTLPSSDQAQEDLQWVLREIVDNGGEGSICDARFIDGLTDAQVEALFSAARDADYAAILDDARAPIAGDEGADSDAPAQVARLRRRLAVVAAIDFFGASGRVAVEGALAEMEQRLPTSPAGGPDSARSGAGRIDLSGGRTWVTRRGVHVDRMASAWLIRRFIDPAARFKFVSGKGYAPEPGELRFDMFEAEFTHAADGCTFEVLLAAFAVADPALRPIAEIVHDIDLKDDKFGREETRGIDRLIVGLAMAHAEDELRVRAADTVWDGLYEYFRRKRA